MLTQEQVDLLRAPFSQKQLEFRVQRIVEVRGTFKAIVLVYITARGVMERLDAVFGVDGWKNEHFEWRDKGNKCRLWYKSGEEWLFKEDASDESDIEGTKGSFSGSLKRAVVHLGVGRYLYDLPEFWVDITSKEQTDDDVYVNSKIKKNGQDVWVKGYWTPPVLPDEFLPEDERGKQPKRKPSQSKTTQPKTTSPKAQGGSTKGGSTQKTTGTSLKPSSASGPSMRPANASQAPSGGDNAESKGGLPDRLKVAIVSTVGIAAKKGKVIQTDELIQEMFQKDSVNDLTPEEAKQLIFAINKQIAAA